MENNKSLSIVIVFNIWNILTELMDHHHHRRRPKSGKTKNRKIDSAEMVKNDHDDKQMMIESSLSILRK